MTADTPGPAPADPRPEIESLSFEQALEALEGVVKRLETGSSTLQGAITDYEYGMHLKRHCEKHLAAARLDVERITLGASEEAAAAPIGGATDG